MTSLHEYQPLPQGNHKRSGTVLLRRQGSRNGENLLLFLKEIGPVWVTAPGGSSKGGRASGLDSLYWGVFELYQGPRRSYLREFDMKEDFLSIRKSYSRLLMALEWTRLLSKNLLQLHPYDELLTLFWNALKQLEIGVTPSWAELRFFWRWANLMGQAPSLDHCYSCGQRVLEGARMRDGVLCTSCLGGSTNSAWISRELLQDIKCTAMLRGDSFIEWGVRRTFPEEFCGYRDWLRSFLAANG